MPLNRYMKPRCSSNSAGVPSVLNFKAGILPPSQPDTGGLLLREVDRKMNLLPRFRQVHAVTSSPRAIALLQCRFSAACTMNMAWKRRPHEAGLNSCGPQLIEAG